MLENLHTRHRRAAIMAAQIQGKLFDVEMTLLEYKDKPIPSE